MDILFQMIQLFGYAEFISDIVLTIPGHLDLEMTRSWYFCYEGGIGCTLIIFSHVNIIM